MNEHDLILLATKHGSWFGNTLELRKEGLVAMAKEIEAQAQQIEHIYIPVPDDDWHEK